MGMIDTSQFIGTENWHRIPGMPFTFTDGVKYVAEHCDSYWLITHIFSKQLDKKIGKEAFQVWKLEVSGNKATLTCEDGNGNAINTDKIPFTDFPEPGVTLWFSVETLLLPTEY